jgi:hypothetical protein
MVVIRQTCGGSYCLAELDGTVSKLHYTRFRLIPYLARSRAFIPVTHILDREDLISIVQDTAEVHENDNYDGLTGDGQILNPREM